MERAAHNRIAKVFDQAGDNHSLLAADQPELRAYASAGMKECWLVLGPEKQIEVHRQPQGGEFAEHAVHGPGGTLTSAAVPGFTVELDRLFTA